MNLYIKHKIIIFFSSLILALPIANALHFVLIDHTINLENENAKKIVHQCDDYIFHSVFDIHHPSVEIQSPQWFSFLKQYIPYYSNHYHVQVLHGINNRGPPMFAFSKALS